MARIDPYKILGVDSNFTIEELERKYKRLAKRWHPDKNPDNPEAEEKFKDIATAYRILKDPGSRLLYDQTGEPERPKMEDEMRGVLLMGFQDAITGKAERVLAHVRGFLEGNKKNFATQKSRAAGERR